MRYVHSHGEILAVRSSLIARVGAFKGISRDVQRYLDVVLNPKNQLYIDRISIEHDPEYKQIVGYVVLRHKGEVFQFRRGPASVESRLHSKLAIAVGGHICKVQDAAYQDVYHETYRENLRQEFLGKVRLSTAYQDSIVAVINDEDDFVVGRFHFGIVHIYDLLEPHVEVLVEGMIEPGFVPISSIRSNWDQYERWSQLVAQEILAIT